MRPPLSSAAQQQGNQGNLMQNSGQPGMINPQIGVPFNNPNTHLSNGNVFVPTGSISPGLPCFLNAPNPFLSLQNGMSLLGLQQNLNMAMNQLNASQLAGGGQFSCNYVMNPAQFLNPNAGLPNGQYCFQNPMQNMNQFLQMQVPNYTQTVTGNLPLSPSQGFQGMRPQNLAFFTNPQFANQDQNKLLTAQQLQGNSPMPLAFGSSQQQQTHSIDSCQPVLMNSQDNSGKDGGINNLNTNWKNSRNTNFSRNPKHNASNKGFMKAKFMHNAKGKFQSQNERGGKGYNNDRTKNYGLGNSTKQSQVEKKRSLAVFYTQQEIQQWRDERRKNYPSKMNMEKKLAAKLSEPELTNKEARLRREQLKEILAKQAELGCEVAEIPSSFLADPDQQVLAGEEVKRPFGKKERFQNRFNKRGRFQNDVPAKKHRSAGPGLSSVNDQNRNVAKNQVLENNDPSSSRKVRKREPTLLEKLLSADIKRDKRCLLQVFRFMVMNSFFKDWPEKPLTFPSVLVKETDGAGEVLEEKSLDVGKGVFEGTGQKSNCKSSGSDDVGNGSDDKLDVQIKQKLEFEGLEEEGEIID